LRVQSYKGEAFYETSGEINRTKSDELRYEIELIANRTGWKFCDATSRILHITRKKGKAVHGPRDWKHFNELGYTAVKDTYLDCLSLP
jgi:acyl-CoA thioesterase FadM